MTEETKTENGTEAKKNDNMTSGDVGALLVAFLVGCLVTLAVCTSLGRPHRGEVAEGFAHPKDVVVNVYDYQDDSMPETIISHKGVPALLKVDEWGHLFVVYHQVVLEDTGAGRGEEDAPWDDGDEDPFIDGELGRYGGGSEGKGLW